MGVPKLSPKALDIIEKLQHEIKQVIDSDRVREPKLTPEEKEEVAKLEAEIAKHQPIWDQLTRKLVEVQAEHRDLQLEYKGFVIEDIETADNIATKFVTLPEKIRVLEETHRYVAYVVNSSKLRIKEIKEEAREREVKNGR